MVNVAQNFKEVSREDLQPREPVSLVPAIGRLTEDMIIDGIGGNLDKCDLLER